MYVYVCMFKISYVVFFLIVLEIVWPIFEHKTSIFVYYNCYYGQKTSEIS